MAARAIAEGWVTRVMSDAREHGANRASTRRPLPSVRCASQDRRLRLVRMSTRYS